MRMRLGLGPVFAYEWLTTSRRWQVYAARSLFVAFLLLGLTMVWSANDDARSRSTIQGQAEVGLYFYQVIVGTQLVLLLLAAPAATAGSICLDKARGALTHLLMTDLSNAEVVLGKLAARLVSVLGLVACALPAMALGSLLGGVDPRALTGAFLVSLGVATFGCTLALVLSVWGVKSSEVLMATYAILLVWILASPALLFAKSGLGLGAGSPEWLDLANPFWLVFGNSWQPGTILIEHDLLFLAASLGISALLVVVAVVRVRSVASRQAGQAPGRRGWFASGGRGRSVRDAIGPRLDFNPVLWCEWHRRRPSRWSRILWGFYAGAAVFVSVVMVYLSFWGTPFQRDVGTILNGGQVAIGFLLLSVASATSLSEDRARGRLDILLTTPMSTRAIVFGKWWGAYRGVILLSILPAIVTVAIAVRGGYWLGVPLVVGLILSFGAAQASLGLALATWISRPGRVMALSVSAYVLITIGWVFVAILLDQGSTSVLGPGLGSASPFIGASFPLGMMQKEVTWSSRWPECVAWLRIWIVVYTVLALSLLASTLATFDRCLGRVSTRCFVSPPRPGPEPIINRAAVLD